MRHESSVTSLSWIPSEAVPGVNKVIFGTGFTHYDDPPPDRIDDLAALQAADRFRFANVLSAWIEVTDGQIVAAGYAGGCTMGATTVSLGAKQATFAAAAFPDIQWPVEITGRGATFVQTVGGHTAVPAPRRVSRPPFVAFQAPTVWSTLSLTITVDGGVEWELLGASSFPRHWIYDADGVLCSKVGLADFKDWWRHAFGDHTPWGDEDSPAMVTAVETALERELASLIMRGGAKPDVRTIRKGSRLTEQGGAGEEIFLLLNGVLGVEVDGERLAEIGPGAILGVRSALEGGVRTATLEAMTAVKVAAVRPEQVDPAVLAEIGAGHHREDERRRAVGG